MPPNNGYAIHPANTNDISYLEKEGDIALFRSPCCVLGRYGIILVDSCVSVLLSGTILVDCFVSILLSVYLLIVHHIYVAYIDVGTTIHAAMINECHRCT